MLNNDILEETLSGKSSTHCTNGILVQRSASTAVIVEPRSFLEPDNVRGWNSNALFREPVLTCDHKEADTRMFVHAKHACSTKGGQAQTVVISLPDTDVAVIGIYIHSLLMPDYCGRLVPKNVDELLI